MPVDWNLQRNYRLIGPVITGIMVCLSGISAANAGVVVSWGGDYVSKSELFDGSVPSNTGGTDDYGDPVGPLTYNTDSLGRSGSIAGRLVSDSVQYNPVIGPSYGGTNQEFYGGHAAVYSAPPNKGLTNLIVENQGTQDPIHVEAQPDADLQRFAMLTYWQKTNFLGPGGTFLVNGTSVFSLDSTQDSNDKDPTEHTLRWVVRNGQQFYLSDAVSFVNNGTYTASLVSLTSWTEYNPLGSPPTGPTLDKILLSNSQGSTGFSPLGFNDVTAVGFYVEFLRPLNKNGAISLDYKIKGFNATLDPNGHTVPEPSTFALGLIGVTGAAVRRWRKRRGAKAEDAPAEPTAEPLSEVTL